MAKTSYNEESFLHGSLQTVLHKLLHEDLHRFLQIYLHEDLHGVLHSIHSSSGASYL